MLFRNSTRALSLLIASAALTGLSIPAESHAANKPKAHAAHSSAAKGDEVKFREAEAMREAYIILAGGNHDYNGHRAKAMHAVKTAFKLLDDHVMKHGTPQEQEATVTERAAVAAAEKKAQKSATVHERQASSDAQLKKAKDVLAEVQTLLTVKKQKMILSHVDAAINEITTALKVR